MKLPIHSLIALLALCHACQSLAPETSPPPAHLEANDPTFFDLIDRNAPLDTLAEGFDWSEGPVWLPQQKMLLWSDVPQNVIWSWQEGQEASKYLRPSGYTGEGQREGSNGLILNENGELVLCQHGNRQLAYMDAPLDQPQPTYQPIVAHYQGQRFNSPNDVIQDSRGRYWFTDPPYGLPQQEQDPERELDFQGVYRSVSAERPDSVLLIAKELSRPNGLALSPDERHLYVANSDPERAIWMRYPLTEDGLPDGPGEVFFDATEWVPDRPGLPDGLKVRDDGILFATGPGGVLVLHPDGRHLGTINTGQATANCALNEDGTKLYITADGYVMRIALKR